MELSLTKNNPLNTVFMTPEGLPMYEVNTAKKILNRGNTTITNVLEKMKDVGMIEWHSMRKSIVTVGRRIVTPKKNGTFSTSYSFIAIDGWKYKWKIDSHFKSLPLLVVDDGSDTPVATFTKAQRGWFSKPRVASLSITPLGMRILDDIVTTFVWFEQTRRDDEATVAAVNANG